MGLVMISTQTQYFERQNSYLSLNAGNFRIFWQRLANYCGVGRGQVIHMIQVGKPRLGLLRGRMVRVCRWRRCRFRWRRWKRCRCG